VRGDGRRTCLDASHERAAGIAGHGALSWFWCFAIWFELADLDQPSTGLHPLDVATLVDVFDRLLEAGATIIVIDHDLDLLAAADHLIDMGPGGGPDGGQIVAAESPEDVARVPDSVTGPWLAEYLGLPHARQPGVLARGQSN
jgi:ABC-type transporter Mla maintaining outer membrane lipid asymmetry ATPase subunit MlaF